MNDFLSRNARTVLLGDRQCTATNRDGQRCGRSSALGQFVCDKHGAKAPLSQKAGRERLMTLAEPALDALFRALKSGPPCEACGRSDADKDPVVIRAAQIVLDRAGYGPSATMQVVNTPDEKYADFTDDQLVEHLEAMLKSAIELRDANRQSSQRQQRDGVIDAEGYLVPEDAEEREESPIHERDVQFPLGNETPESDEGAK